MLSVDDLDLEVRWSHRRRSVQLTVDRSGELVVFAPAGTKMSDLEDFVRERKTWVYTKLARKDLLRTEAPAREMATGEGFPYLGRTFRLELVRAQDRPLKLSQGRFRLLRTEKLRGREHFASWYTDHAHPWIAARVDRFADRMAAEPDRIAIRDLGHRWGSCGKARVLNFHWATIVLPPTIVEYVIVHELAHLHEQHHTPEYWRRVERVLPDYEHRKAWLATNGADFARL